MKIRSILETVLRRWYVWAVLALAVCDWFLLQRGVAEHPSWVLSILVVLAATGWLVEAARTVGLAARRRIGRVRAAGRLMMLLSLVVIFGSGVANWLWSLQGYVVLKEREAVPLTAGSHLMAFEAGPLSKPAALDLTVQLVEVELVGTPDGGLFAKSTVRVRGPDGKVIESEVSPHQVAPFGSLRFYQGAFGFAPRIVILRGDETIFDEVIPFMTRVHDRGAYLSFEEAWTIEAQGLEVWGGIDMSSLDEAFRGHAMLVVAVRRDGRELGQGRLSIGHFAEIEDGYRIGFAGLERWSEIDFSRRNYRRQMVWAVGVFLIGFGVLVIRRILTLRGGDASR